MNEHQVCQEQVLQARSSYKGKGKMFEKSSKSNSQHKDTQEHKNECVAKFGKRNNQRLLLTLMEKRSGNLLRIAGRVRVQRKTQEPSSFGRKKTRLILK